MLRLEEKLKERGNQKKHLEKIDKYPVVDDPRRISQLLKEMTDSFSSLSEQEMEFRVRRVVQDNSVYGFPLSKKELNRRLTQMGRKDMHQLNALALAYSNNFEKITPFFIESDRDLLRNWARLSLSKVSYFKKNNGEIVRILPSAFFNPLTAWFVDDAYLDLDESVRFLTENLTDNGEVEEKVYLLMLLGHLSGKFTQPESVQYKRFFRQFIHRDSPALLRELIQITDDERPEYEHKQERLQKLKSYWHEVFVQAWMAKAKLQYDGRKALSQADQIIGQQNLGMDMRPSDTIKGAESFGMSLEMKSPHLEGEGQRQAEMYQAEELHLERKAKESKWNAQQYMSEVLQLYNLNHTLLINKEGRTEGKWSRFRQKIPLIFQLAVSQGKDLMKKSASIGERATILDNVAIQLIDVIDRDQDCLDLFGHDFYEINPIEQVSLILFTALSLAGEKERPRLLVQLCSRALVPHLLEYQISKKKEDVTVGNDRVSLSEVDWKSYQGVAYNAFNKMNHMPIESGFCHSDSQELNSIASEVDQVTKELSDIILTPKFKEQSGRRKFVLAGLFVLANLYFGIQIGDKIGSFLDEKNFNEVQAIFLMLILQAFVGLATYVFVRNFGSKKVFKKLKESDFLEVVNELQELIPEEKKASSRLRSIVMSGITIAIFSFSALRVYSDFLEDASGVQEVLPESSGPPSIPDQISPESLTQLPWVLRGSLNYIPEGMDPESTIPVGYQSDYWLNESGSGFSTSGDHGTAAVELVSSQADIDYVPSENEIMYSVPMRSLKLLPLDGYRITRLFQVGGKPAERGTAGEYYFDVNDYPDSVVIVAERMQPDEHFGNGIVSYSEIRGPGYQPWDNWLEKRNDAVALNSKLSGDLQLQQLHLSLIQEIDLLYARWQTGDLQSQIDHMSQEYSNIGQRYTVLFSQYIQSSRYYSLRFSSKDIDGETYLEDIALDRDRAFFCSIASYGLQEFMESVGVAVVVKPGYTLYAFEGGLYSRIGHINAMVILPNGKIIFIDPTPQRPKPGEDLSSLELKPIEAKDLKPTPQQELLEKLAYLVVGSTTLGGSALSLTALSNRRKRRKRPLEQKIEGQLPAQHQSNVLRSSYQILSLLISFSTDDYQKMVDYHGGEDEFLKNVAHDGIEWLLNSNHDESESAEPFDLERMIRKERDSQEEIVDSKTDRKLLIQCLEVVDDNLKLSAQTKKKFVLSEKDRILNDYRQIIDELEQTRHEFEESRHDQQKISWDQTIKSLNTRLSEIEEDLSLIEEHLQILENATELRRVLNEIRKFIVAN